ncbi:SURF1 family protein [Nonomuraea sp. CA-218870]|uniref:SURF1 family cytochrome oxidase biogenesis protein n=1 Tax=Nonomuraea sp. CA-218870 TaxID=3239998 RepID=UPI003D8B0B2F
MYRFLLTPRWVALHIVVLLVIPAFVFLGQWQFGRFEERSADSDLVTRNIERAPVPLETLVRPGGTAEESDRFRNVTVTGTYDPAQELVVRRRPQNGRPGYFVITPLVTGGGHAVLVNRGWVPAGASADEHPAVPPPPTGEVTVTGRLRPSETEANSGIKERSGLPPRQVLLINPASIGRSLTLPLLDGYVELTGQQPPSAAAPEPVNAPDVGSGGGLNLAYGVQWWLFIGIAVGGWALLIKREVADRKAQESVAQPEEARTD